MNEGPNGKPSVCRKLFADDDDAEENTDSNAQANVEEACLDNVRNNFLEDLQQERAAARERWNFDFETETPLEGNWEWQRVEPRPHPAAAAGRVHVQPAEDATHEGNKSL